MKPKVTLFRAIDEMSTVIIATEIKRALEGLSDPRFDFQMRTAPRIKLPARFNIPLGSHRLNSDALDSYFARLIQYPLAARFQRAEVYHITDDMYGAIVRALDPRRCIVTVNHGTPEIFRDELNVGTGVHFRVQRYVFNSVTRAAFIVTASEWMRQHILGHYALSPERVVCNPYGVNPIFHPRSPEICARSRAQYRLPSDAFVLLHVGNCGPNKNVETILRALAALPEQIHLAQVGGRWADSHRAIIESHHLQSRVHALGFVPHPALLKADDAQANQLAELYCACNAFVFPSTLEGFGMPLVEAMASGLPVITSNLGTMSEVGGDGAIQIAPRDPEILATAIQALEQSSEQRQFWRQASLRRAQHFSWKRHAEMLIDLYCVVYESVQKNHDRWSPYKFLHSDSNL